MKTTLVILAAGIGSRYGKGIKQLARMGANGEMIMDYSIYDAKEAGFDKVVFIIRKEIEDEFHAAIGSRIKEQIEVEYVCQETSDVPEPYKELAKARKKPWGTGHAILCCRGVVKEPFVIINADDYYGKEAFVKLHNFLVSDEKSGEGLSMAMAGFLLKNTLSANGTVTRGVCRPSGQYLAEVIETYGIKEENGRIVCDNPEVSEWIQPLECVSMNMWAAPPQFIDELEAGFERFLENLGGEAGETEYLLPTVIDQMIKDRAASVKILKTNDQWFGITYQEDKQAVQEEFAQLIKNGVYPADLWEKDLE